MIAPAEIDEVAVEVDIVLVDPGDMGEALGIDHVDQQNGGVIRQIGRRLERPALQRRFAKALCPMRATGDRQDPFAILGAARQDIDVDWLFVGPFFRVRNNRVVPIPRCACSIEQVRGVQHLGLQTLAHCHRLLGMEAAPIDREGSRTFTSGSSWRVGERGEIDACVDVIAEWIGLRRTLFTQPCRQPLALGPD